MLQNSFFDRYSIALTYKYNNEGVIKNLDVKEIALAKKKKGLADKNVHIEFLRPTFFNSAPKNHELSKVFS